MRKAAFALGLTAAIAALTGFILLRAPSP